MHQELYQYIRLLLEILSAPALFQKTRDITQQGIPHVCCYTDDLLVTGVNKQEHLQNLKNFCIIWSRITSKLGNQYKFFKDSVEYLGHSVARCSGIIASKVARNRSKGSRPQNFAAAHSWSLSITIGTLFQTYLALFTHSNIYYRKMLNGPGH